MRKWMKNIKLIIAVSSMLAMFAIAPVVHGGITWSGIDPIFLVNGHQFNVYIEWPSQYTCTIQGPIEVDVRVPNNAPYAFIMESSDDVGGCGSPQFTETKVDFDNRDNVEVKTEVHSAQVFPVRVLVYLDGLLVRTYEGMSSDDITGDPIAIPQ